MFKLFDYQQKLVTEIRKALIDGNQSVLIVSPPGSGKSVVIAEIARLTTLKGNRVMFTVHKKELVKQIRETFIKQNVDMKLCTIMTVGKIKNRLSILPRPNLIITDETHHSLAKTYQKIYDYYSDVPRLGFTATPWRLSGQGLSEIYDVMIEGKAVKWLIDHHHLAPYKYWCSEDGNRELLKKSSTGDFTQASMDEFSKYIIRGDIVKNWIEHGENRKTIIYCHSIQFSQEVVKAFNDAGINAIHVDSKTPSKKRDQIMEDFRNGKIKILSNVDLISEGFDVPDCGCVVLLRPTASLVLYLQQAMRCMRYQPGKEAIIIDQIGNVHSFGAPATERKWSLEARKRKNNASNEGPSIRECPQCYAWFEPVKSKNICPICGFKVPVEERKDKIEVDEKAKLTKFTSDDEQYVANYKYLDVKPSELNSVEELKEYAKVKGYKPGWIYFQQKQRGWLK
ncbi:DEAD/DEAH box helicase [Lactobacillus sp.]|uniref:DEAD/DEAH box helicase n=1 Tax=Lactobacillus sp. TaxID=1591 RepID=UPI00199C87FE|nr:DEAD/DEAH box helicase [Lactobacillus sp.]MBD5429688.1 DEAD/DEAH box helicase family protein [Lactobacillus sp.]